MAENYIEKIDSLMGKFNSEAGEIISSLKELKGRDRDTNELVQELRSIRDSITSETHYKTLSNSIEELESSYENASLDSGEVDKMIDGIGQQFSTSIKDKMTSIQDLAQSVSQNNQYIVSGFSTFNSFFSDALQPFQDIAGLLGGTMSILRGSFGYVGSMFSLLRKGRKKEDEQTSTLKDINSTLKDQGRTSTETMGQTFSKYNQTDPTDRKLDGLLSFFRKQDKEEDREKKKKEDGGFLSGLFDFDPATLSMVLKGALFGAVGALGLALGGVIRSLTLPFEVLYKAVKPIITLAQSILGMLNKIPQVAKITSKISSLFGKVTGIVTSMVSKVSGIMQMVSSKMPLLGKLFSSIARGFKVLGWPVAIIFGVIDFIKGFTQEQGSLFDKMKAGLTSALTGFFELPVKMIGWIGDKILSVFGIKIKGGVGKKIMSGLKKMLDKFFSVFRGIIEPIGNVIQNMITALSPDNILSSLSGVARAIASPVDTLIRIVDWLKDRVMDTLSLIVKPFKGIKNAIVGLWNKITGDEEGEGTNVFSIISEKLNGLVEGVISFITNLIPSWDDIKKGVGGVLEKVSSLFSGDEDKSAFDKLKEDSKLKTDAANYGMMGGVTKYSIDKSDLQDLSTKDLQSLLNEKDKLSGKTIKDIKSLIDLKEKAKKSTSDVGQPTASTTQEVVKERDQSRAKAQTDTKRAVDQVSKEVRESSQKSEQTKEVQVPMKKPVQEDKTNKDVPDEIENLSLFLYNKNWGIM